MMTNLRQNAPLIAVHCCSDQMPRSPRTTRFLLATVQVTDSKNLVTDIRLKATQSGDENEEGGVSSSPWLRPR